MSDRWLDLAARVEALARSRRVRVALLLLVTLYGVRHVTRAMGDFKVYRRAAQRMISGEPVYQLEDPHRYLYAPVVTFLFLPLGVLPRPVGKILWFVFNTALLVSIFRCSVRLLFPEGRAPPGFYALVLLLSFRFIDNNLGHGQLNILLLWLVLRAYVDATCGRCGLAGFALAAAIAAKIVPAVLLMQILLRRQWRFAACTAIGFVVLMTVPVLWWGSGYPQVLRDWIAVVVDQAGHYEMGNKINQSIAAFVYRLTRPYPGGAPLLELPEAAATVITALLHALFLVPLALLSLRLAAGGRTEPAGRNGDELSLYLLYATVAAPYSWKYYFVSLIFPFGAAVARLAGAERREFGGALLAVFVLDLLPGLELLGKRLATLFQLWSFHFLAVVVLFALLWRSAFRRAHAPTFPSSRRVC
ncbi:MAG TPA: glycosyltransferase family 87 protein [Candidatus Binatia bacterium]|nr:glycosyltransferase family 87 protein [Candidatus Binatia bacterium]